MCYYGGELSATPRAITARPLAFTPPTHNTQEFQYFLTDTISRLSLSNILESFLRLYDLSKWLWVIFLLSRALHSLFLDWQRFWYATARLQRMNEFWVMTLDRLFLSQPRVVETRRQWSEINTKLKIVFKVFPLEWNLKFQQLKKCFSAELFNENSPDRANFVEMKMKIFAKLRSFSLGSKTHSSLAIQIHILGEQQDDDQKSFSINIESCRVRRESQQQHTV